MMLEVTNRTYSGSFSVSFSRDEMTDEEYVDFCHALGLPILLLNGKPAHIQTHD